MTGPFPLWPQAGKEDLNHEKHEPEASPRRGVPHAWRGFAASRSCGFVFFVVES
jgi:hypothetical protein